MAQRGSGPRCLIGALGRETGNLNSIRNLNSIMGFRSEGYLSLRGHHTTLYPGSVHMNDDAIILDEYMFMLLLRIT